MHKVPARPSAGSKLYLFSLIGANDNSRVGPSSPVKLSLSSGSAPCYLQTKPSPSKPFPANSRPKLLKMAKVDYIRCCKAALAGFVILWLPQPQHIPYDGRSGAPCEGKEDSGTCEISDVGLGCKHTSTETTF